MALSYALPLPDTIGEHFTLRVRSVFTEVIKDEKTKGFLPMELRLLGKAKIFHWRNKGVEVPFMQIGVQLERQCSFHIVLRLKVSLRAWLRKHEHKVMQIPTLTS